MLKKILYGCTLVALLTSCNEDFDDWAAPQGYSEEEGLPAMQYNVTPVEEIDIATAEDVIPFFTYMLNMPAGFVADGIVLNVVDEEGGTLYPLECMVEAGEVSVLKSDLAAIVESIYGKRPTARDITYVTRAYAFTSDSKTIRVCSPVNRQTIQVTPEAPNISSAYYLIGTPQGWSNSEDGATSMPLNHSDADVYDDPVFTITFAAPKTADGSRDDCWFSVLAGDDCEAFVGGDWNVLIGNTEKNGSTALSGKLQSRSEFGGDNNFMMPASDGASFYTLTINMMDMTYTITPLNFGAYFYEIGGESGWSTSHALYGANFDGKYQGYYYLNGEFKFKPNENNWEGDYEYDGEGRIADNGGSNCPDPGAGFYQIDVDLAAGTYQLTTVNSITVVGNFNGWNQADQSTHMTYNVDGGYWEATLNLDSNGFKFAMNDDWSVSWGGANGDPAAYDNLTQNNGKDLDLPNGAGTYNIKLYLSYEGANKVVLTKQ